MPVKPFEIESNAQWKVEYTDSSGNPVVDIDQVLGGYSLEQMEKDIAGFEDYRKELRASKGHDYSGVSDDTLDNLRDFGFLGIIVRMGDKYKRLKNFALQGELKVKDESIKDTLHDMVNYANYALIFLGEK